MTDGTVSKGSGIADRKPAQGPVFVGGSSTRLLRSLLALALCMGWLTAQRVSPLEAQAAPDDWRIERLEWTSEVKAGQAVTIVNPFGDVRARGGRGQEVYVLAVAQRHLEDPRQPKVTGVEGDDGRFNVEVGYPDSAIPETIPEAWQRRRVDLTVFVPAPASTSITAMGGVVNVKGLNGELEISTRTGDIFARSAGRLAATSEHGSILAQLRRTDWNGVSRLETVTGTIRVELPRDQRLATAIETRGEITTDYSLEIQRETESRLKRARTIPVGDPRRLELKSYQGAIELIESLVPADNQVDPNENNVKGVPEDDPN